MGSSQIITADIEESCFHFRVGGELTKQTLPNIRRLIRQQFDCCREIEIDFSDVSVVDSKGIRAMLSIRRKALRKNKSLHFVSRNEAFLKLLDLMKSRVFPHRPRKLMAEDGQGTGGKRGISPALPWCFTSEQEASALPNMVADGSVNNGFVVDQFSK